MVVTRRLAGWLAVGLLFTVAFGVTTFAAQRVSGGPHSGPQLSYERADPPTMLSIAGSGAQALVALEIAAKALPYAALMPDYVPDGYRLARTEVRAVGNTAVLDVAWLGTGDQQLHLFEVNSLEVKPEQVASEAEDSVVAAGLNWRYRLLVYPQAGGQSFRLHHLTTNVGATRVSLDLRAGSDLAADKLLLVRVADSLR